MESSWLHRPQQVGLRRALFQLHLWVSLVLGLYILVISISGSAVVLRREYHRWFAPGGMASTVTEWLVRLHDDLLGGTTGRVVNGVGAALLLLVLLTGTVLWWPGKARWWQGLVLNRPVNSLRFVRQLHSFLGFWSFALLLLWVVTALYFAFPQVFEGLIDYFDPNLEDAHRPGEQLLYESVSLHFGRFSGMKVRIAWILLGLVPALLFVTGFITWWKRQRQAARQNFSRAPT